MVLIFIFAFIIATSATPQLIPQPKVDVLDDVDYSSYRLSDTTIPTHYDIHLQVPRTALEGGSTTYEGSVKIEFNVLEGKDIILLSSLVNIISIEVLFTDNDTTVGVSNFTSNLTTEIVTIEIDQNLEPNTTYTLSITFTSTLDPFTTNGFYRSEYKTGSVTEYLGTTQFEPTYARKAFPCFDEPEFKATFGLALTYPSDFVASANTLESQRNSTAGDGLTKIEFENSPIMPTYLLAFTVSHFTCLEDNDTLNIPQRVCSRNDFAEQREFSSGYAAQLLEALNTWTNYNYNTSGPGKMDHYAIPDFSAGAMENWGLVTYREYLLMYSDADTSSSYAQSIITVIAHELAHMWFGNLVTMKWWDSLFLNEGFATYFEYLLLNEIPGLEHYEMEKQYIIEVQQTALRQDGVISSLPLVSQVWTPTQIYSRFSVISYQKGGSILRMVENLMGSTNFKNGVREYLSSNALGSSTAEILWTTIGSYVTSGTLPDNVTFLEFIENWTNAPGYPVVQAKVVGNDVILSQKRFLYSGTSDTQWYIPIKYVISSGSTILQEDTVWMQPSATETLLNATAYDKWIILNHNSAGYYRIHYDNTLRERIISVLRNNHEDIDDVSRAQIIDDAMNLALASQITYTEALGYLEYLQNETSYYPWYSALNGLNNLYSRLGRESDTGKKLDQWLLEHMDTTNLFNTDWNAADQVTLLKTPIMWHAACQAGHQPLISVSKYLLADMRLNSVSVNKEIRRAVYCNALRYSDDVETDFNFLVERLNTTEQPHEILYLLQGLGCTTSSEHLIKYLGMSISSEIRPQDFSTVWSSVLGTLVGVNTAFEYFMEKHSDIIAYNPSAVSMISTIAARFTSSDQISQLEQFISGLDPNSTLRTLAESSHTSAVQNLRMQEAITKDLETYFGPLVSSAGKFEMSLLTMLLCMFALRNLI